MLTIKHGIFPASNLTQYILVLESTINQLNSCLMGICIDTYDNIYVTDVGDVDNEKPVIMLNRHGG